MFINNTSWQNVLTNEFKKEYFIDLMQQVTIEYQTCTCFPLQEKIFAAFEKCSFDDLKVVILGQDPYHGEGEANGLAFSVNDGVKIPPSLRNIFSEINLEFDTIFTPTSGNLERWAKQGVLLLNATLTVKKDSPNSHKHLDWQTFTNAVIEIISTQKEHVVFMLWGNFAQKKINFINQDKHLVLKNGHPSPMSYNRKLWICNKKDFTTTNLYLSQNGLKPINW